MNGCEVSFPNLGITFSKVASRFQVFGFPIAYYGVIIACGMISGYFMALWTAKRTGQKTDLYEDYALWGILSAVVGARLYYVVFAWDQFASHPLEIFNLRGGGLAIYGGVIGGIVSAVVYAKIKKKEFWLMADTACIGLITGQIIGRFGNFFNKEAFGGYTDGLFAMALPWDVAVSNMSADSAAELAKYVENGVITVHPTFLYEAAWNLMVLLFMIFYTPHKKFHGEVFFIYLAGYGLGRAWIEGLRTDQLLLWNTSIPASQLLAVLMFVVATALIVAGRIKAGKKQKQEKTEQN